VRPWLPSHKIFRPQNCGAAFHRIRHYGLFANANRAGNIALARHLLSVPDPGPSSEGDGAKDGPEH